MDVKTDKIFYDIHCHAFNLSHANFSAFILRFLKDIVNQILLFPYKVMQWLWKVKYSLLIIAAAVLLALVGLFFLMRSYPVFWQALKAAYSFIVRNALYILLILLLIPLYIFLKTYIKKSMNLLSLIENDIGTYFLWLEDDIIDSKLPDNYDRVILTPLMMDFQCGPDVSSWDVHYNDPKKGISKPISEQVVDVFNGIRFYRKKSRNRILEIYPFLGINTQNYLLDNNDTASIVSLAHEIASSLPADSKISWNEANVKSFLAGPHHGKMSMADREQLLSLAERSSDTSFISRIYTYIQYLERTSTLKSLLDKYFGHYSCDYRTYKKAFEAHFPVKRVEKGKHFTGTIAVNDMSHYFAGIKIYPPLGMDPWPEHSPDQLKKVEYLYQYCCCKGIPITTHCSDGGFKVLPDEKIDLYTNPAHGWTKALAEYPNLKINLAHMGLNTKIRNKMNFLKKKNWFETIYNLVIDNENVYTDFSCSAFDFEFYNALRDLLESKNKRFYKRLLFGSDIMVNLFWTDSYQDYLEKFNAYNFNLKAFDPQEDVKYLLATENPRCFLFSANVKNKSCKVSRDHAAMMYDGCGKCPIYKNTPPSHHRL